jgi:response regulator RpfG family c-di-GMP phosphodiesterase
MKSVSFNQGPQVLVVDDHRISRLHTVQALRQVVGLVKQAQTAEEARRSALTQLPQLIFLDVHLGESCGLAFLKSLRQSWPAQTSLPAIVILTGDGSPDMRRKLELASVSAVLLKPVPAKQIREITVQLLQLDRAVRENPGQDSVDGPETRLYNIFLEELRTRLPELDRHITSLDWGSARHILHQLTASSAMCGDKDLELQCRQLFFVLDSHPQPHALAQAYHPFSQALTDMKTPFPN